jgi:large subunit ribosomal protein L23
MGIFGKKEQEKKETTVVETPVVALQKKVSIIDTTSVIKRPRITEKAALKSEAGVYTFEVRNGATKNDVRDAIKAIYNVTPIKVNIVNQAPRSSMSRSRGRSVVVHGLRKAYVYLKKGDRIELV